MRNKLDSSLLSFRILILFNARLPLFKCFLPCYSVFFFFPPKDQLHTYGVLGPAQRTFTCFIYLARFIGGVGVPVEVSVRVCAALYWTNF